MSAPLLRVTLTGDRALRAKFERAIHELQRKELRAAVKAVVKPIFERTQELVPVDEGDLKGTGKFTVLVSPARNEIGGRIVYGGPDAPYAREQHENLELEHPNGGQAKYVTTPVLAARSTLGPDLAREIDLRRVFR